MEAEKFQQIEQFLFKYKMKDNGAAQSMSDIVGVFIGLKPSAVIGFSSVEMENINCMEFRKLLESIGLKSIFYYEQKMSINKLVWLENVYISRDLNMAVELRDDFVKLWESMDDFGLVVDEETWVKATKRIGELLGYPNTAVESFVRNKTEKRSGEDLLTIVGGKYRYFAHSKEYANKENEVYDKPLNEAIKKYAPMTDEVWGE